jgi:hypothetical protein
MRLSGVLLACAGLLWAVPNASAQESERAFDLVKTVKAVAHDPATYMPVAAKYGAMTLDWESSQIFFRNGFVEHNPRYTVSGQTNDVALSHGAGSRKVVGDSLMLLVHSVPANLAERTVERLLIRRYSNHKRTWLVLGQASRILGSSYLSYMASARHVQQWRRNERLAQQLGYK